MKIISIVLVALFLITGIAMADVSISDNLKKISALKQGIAYSVIDSRFNYLSTIEVLKKDKVSLEVGYAGRGEATDHKLIGVISYNIGGLKDYGFSVPILDLIDANIGVYGGFGVINIGSNNDMKGNNELDLGISLSLISIKW